MGYAAPETSGDKKNKMPSSPTGHILEIAPRTNPGPKRPRVEV